MPEHRVQVADDLLPQSQILERPTELVGSSPSTAVVLLGQAVPLEVLEAAGYLPVALRIFRKSNISLGIEPPLDRGVERLEPLGDISLAIASFTCSAVRGTESSAHPRRRAVLWVAS